MGFQMPSAHHYPHGWEYVFSFLIHGSWLMAPWLLFSSTVVFVPYFLSFLFPFLWSFVYMPSRSLVNRTWTWRGQDSVLLEFNIRIAKLRLVILVFKSTRSAKLQGVVTSCRRAWGICSMDLV
jgi:hypothetical protein